METKCGGVTLEIHGKPVHPGGGLTTAEREAVNRAFATYGRATALLRKMNGAEQRDAGSRDLAEFAAYMGHAITGFPGQLRPPVVKWFTRAQNPTSNAHMTPGVPETWLCLDLPPEGIVRGALHEAMHHAQRDPSGPGAEDEASAFAKRWSRPVWSAYRYVDGRAWRVAFTSARRPPFPGGHNHGAVVIHRERAECWRLNLRASGEPWQRIG